MTKADKFQGAKAPVTPNKLAGEGLGGIPGHEQQPRLGAQSAPLSAEQRLRQARVKMRLIADREMRAFMVGELDYLPGCYLDRTALDAIRTAYAAGLRDGAAA